MHQFCHVSFSPVDDQLIEEAVTDNTLFLEKLSKYLDRESRVIKCWKHLAFVLKVPAEETRKFDMYTEHSPTEDMFNYLTDIWNPDLKVKELKMKLKTIYRNDVIDSLVKGIRLMWFCYFTGKMKKIAYYTSSMCNFGLFFFLGGGGKLNIYFCRMTIHTKGISRESPARLISGNCFFIENHNHYETFIA